MTAPLLAVRPKPKTGAEARDPAAVPFLPDWR